MRYLLHFECYSYSCLTPIGSLEARNYFGISISPSNSARSGLPVYRPDSGFRDVTAGVTLSHQFNDRWGALLRASATRYVGDTADSPIIHEESKTVGRVGVAASYRF